MKPSAVLKSEPVSTGTEDLPIRLWSIPALSFPSQKASVLRLPPHCSVQGSPSIPLLSSTIYRLLNQSPSSELEASAISLSNSLKLLAALSQRSRALQIKNKKLENLEQTTSSL